ERPGPTAVPRGDHPATTGPPRRGRGAAAVDAPRHARRGGLRLHAPHPAAGRSRRVGDARDVRVPGGLGRAHAPAARHGGQQGARGSAAPAVGAAPARRAL
ncbi:MAG: hypothetical protein AVDCRST_MAG38-1706, partial [uncultured Solirubrobacteraceae bacterium]